MSPIFNTSECQHWRQDIEATWAYLNKYYTIRTRDHDGEIRVWRRPVYTLPEQKRIAQAIIHFEPLFDILSPPSTLSWRPRRNWRGNNFLGRYSQTQAIAAVEAAPNLSALKNLMNWASGHNSGFCWEFYNIHYDAEEWVRYTTPPALESASNIIHWSNLILSFVQAAIACKTPGQIRKIAVNHLGLRHFLSGVLSGTALKPVQGIVQHVDLQTGQSVASYK
jgi:hypothetical protein